MESSLQFDARDAGNLQLSGSVASHLREQIISGRIRQGEFLRIDTIAKAMGVSTTPVREGLLLLQSEAFVRLIPRRGFVVNSFNKGDLLDLFWAQATIAGELAARAARRMTPQQVEELQQVHAAHEEAFRTWGPALVRMGHQFHRLINLAADSPRLALLLGNLVRQLPNRFYANIEGHMESTLEYHPIILDAIRVKDDAAVRSLMHRHIMSGAEQLIASLERQGTFGPPSAPPADAAASDSAVPAPRKAAGARR